MGRQILAAVRDFEMRGYIAVLVYNYILSSVGRVCGVVVKMAGFSGASRRSCGLRRRMILERIALLVYKLILSNVRLGVCKMVKSW